MMNAQIERYVALHRSFGRKFDAQERWLRLFASYANDLGDRHIKVERIYDWCRSDSSQNVARDRFEHLRRFCRSEERRVGNEGVSTCRLRVSPDLSKKKHHKK